MNEGSSTDGPTEEPRGPVDWVGDTEPPDPHDGDSWTSPRGTFIRTGGTWVRIA